MRGVFQDWNTAARAHGADGVNVNRCARIVHWNHQLGARGDGCVDRFGGGEQRVAVNVNEDIARAAQFNHVGCGDPSHGCAHYFVARTDVHSLQRQVHERSAACCGNGVLCAGARGNHVFQFGDFGTSGDPTTTEHIRNGGNVLFGDGWTAERQESGPHHGTISGHGYMAITGGPNKHTRGALAGAPCGKSCRNLGKPAEVDRQISRRLRRNGQASCPCQYRQRGYHR